MFGLIKWLLGAWATNIFALYFCSGILRGVSLHSFRTAVYGGLLLGLASALLWKAIAFVPPLEWLSEPLSLGSVSFVMMAISLWITSFFVPGMRVRSFWSAVLGGAFLAAANVLIRHYVL